MLDKRSRTHHDISTLKIKAEFMAHHDEKFAFIRAMDGITSQDMS